ncbi:formyltransferase family protein [Flavobacterium tructae]|uniref:methionyl-tRNA formyltransferase n=1 Tax=Flavobacterium tructae TaxID=1114873 RepID=UPI002551E46D|nr:formyltransferase family protein [Flavobacterium tructae]MDL2143314.1 formyltransferase family protein [Flavobacterium tructae]
MELKLGILASGGLGFNCLIDVVKRNTVDFVFTDSKSKNIIDFCIQNQIKIYIGNPRNEDAKSFIKKFKVDLILSVNYLFIVNDFIYNHSSKYSINFHGSLLPKYRGRTPHVWAIINNEKEAGITGHLISDECDEGAIVYQKKIVIDENMTGADLLKIYEEIYPLAINEIIGKVKNETLNPIVQNHSVATYFGKRTPEDGAIDWNWQKERIKNWVRALSKPYPGAFSFINGKKVIINKVEFTDFGFSDTDLNGKIINVNQNLIVKTQNGAIEIIDFETEDNIVFKIGDIFYARN